MVRNSLVLMAAGLAAMLVAPLSLGAPRHLDTIERECGRHLRMPPQGCKCMRDGAAKLKEAQQAFVAAVVVKDKAAQAEIRQGLTIREMTEAGTFMTSAPARCNSR